jgi:carboxyl-terminal processing protease
MAAAGLLLASLANTLPADDDAPAEVSKPLSLDDLRSFSDVFNTVRLNYVDPVSETRLLDDALRGMVGDLDPYSSYLSPEEFQRQDDSASGQYGGIGITLDIRDQRLVVKDLVEDGPAWQGGVKRGDLILEVNDQPVKGHPLVESMNALLGAPGTTVTVQFQSGDYPPRDVELTREYIVMPSAEGELLQGDIALIRLMQFNKRTADEVRDTLELVAAAAGGSLAGVILDLRDNPGGLVGGATLVADGFLEEGLVVYTRGRYPGSQLEYYAEPGEWISAVPLVILVNGVSASASEILAGALQDHGRALVVGSETYGKGTVQSVLQLRNGSGLKLTTARYYTPAGRSFDRTGITPDVVLDDAQAVEDHPEDDAAVQRALELIGDGEAPTTARPLVAAMD